MDIERELEQTLGAIGYRLDATPEPMSGLRQRARRHRARSIGGATAAVAVCGGAVAATVVAVGGGESAAPVAVVPTTPTTRPGSLPSDQVDNAPHSTPTPPFEPIGRVDMHDGAGYWEFNRWGTIRASGDAKMYGDIGRPLNSPIVAMDSVPSDDGYILMAADGGIFVFGNARFFGSTTSKNLPTPMRSVEITETGLGYTITDAAGEQFYFGDAVPTP